MKKSWAKLEDRVRGIAETIWLAECRPRNIGGVDVDGVIDSSPDIKICIEVTERTDLGKVREDITKLLTAKNALIAQGMHARCFCVLDANPTQAMMDAGKPHFIQVLSADQFSRMFFNFPLYRSARQSSAFGSSVNPLTGKPDDSDYVEVTYKIDDSNKEITVNEIVNFIKQDRNVILLGEYGSGKSRCVREVFRRMADGAEKDFVFPLAIDLRSAWGLRRGVELIRRHIDDLGLDDAIANASIRALNSGHVVLLLDGFDELGAQAWSNDATKLKNLRAKSLEGVKDLLSKQKGGSLICGREHYFNSSSEMYLALGLDAKNCIMIRCKSEFTDEEVERFFHRISQDIIVPSWLPKRPLICQTIADLPEEDFDKMFGSEDDELDFFDHFIRVLCERDARIHASFDAETIRRVLVFLADATRISPGNVGPIGLANVQQAFEAVVGQLPVEEASVMLQRLPALGRVEAESTDRQFIDTYILDGLRAHSTSQLPFENEGRRRDVANSAYRNPLGFLGQRLLAKHITSATLKPFVSLTRMCSESVNQVLASDITGAVVACGVAEIDFGGLRIQGGHSSDWIYQERWSRT